MDVRCEKCMTVYEFDDSQVGENGVTVKCTQCGNLFKVKRRSTTAEHAMGAHAARSPAYVPPAASQPPTPPSPQRTTQRGVPQISPTPPAPAWNPPRTTGARPVVREPAPLPPTVQQPAPPLPPTPPPAPAPMLHPTPTPSATVQARRIPTPARGQAAPMRPEPADEDLALTTTAPMSQPSYEGPMSMGDGPSSMGDDPAFAKTAPKPRITPPAHRVPSTTDLELGNIDDLSELPARKSRAPLFVLFGGLAVIGLVAGTWAARSRLFGGEGRPSEQYLQGRNLFLLDTDDAFQQASALLEQAHGASQSSSEANALVLAALGELDATWAGYLRDDAREIEAKAGAAGEMATRTLRKNAQHYLDEAKRYTGDALALAPDAMEVNRAMAEFLRVDGAPLAEATRYLDRALAKKPADPECTFTRGALLFREGRMDEARAALEQANDLNVKATQKPLYRALFALGRLDAQTAKKDEAKRELTQLTSLDPQHERARTLLASLEAAPPPSPPPVAAIAPPAAVPSAPPAAVAPTGATAKKPATDDVEPATGGGDYNKLVAQADRLSENGRPDQARKLYERALAANPQGVEALTGLGYCDLDGERFMSALDHFKQALNVVPEYGEALIGLGEAYKVRGDKVHAVEFYRRYLKSQPGGPKAAMAKKNLQDLEPHLPPAENAGEDKPRAAPEKAPVEKDDEPKPKSELPKPPPASADEPPP